jgi:hypothetical protein
MVPAIVGIRTLDPARLVTRTKEFDIIASSGDLKSYMRNECELY